MVLPLADVFFHSRLWWVLASAGGALLIGSAVRGVQYWRRRGDRERDRLASLVTWWTLLVLLAAAVWAGHRGVVLLVGLLSALGLVEFRRLTRAMVDADWIWPVALVIAVAHYAALYFGYDQAARVGTPLVALAVLVVAGIGAGRTTGFLRTTSYPLLGLLVIVYAFSHAAMFDVGTTGTPAATQGAALFLLLVLLTEVHDIAQALWGHAVGKRKITPRISPGKTWEGFLLGTATTVLVALFLVPLLMPPSRDLTHDVWTASLFHAAGAGLVIACSAFLGDVCISAIKRDCGVKDSGRLLPGHGGVLDRIDSLTLAAPAFYYYALAFTT